MKQKIILVNGKKRSGKDFFSKIFENNFEFTQFSVARNLKQIASDIAEISIEDLDNLKNNKDFFLIEKDLFELNFKEQLNSVYDKYYKQSNICKSKKVCIQQNINNFNLLYCHNMLMNNEEIDNSIIKVDARKFLQNINIFKTIFEDEDIWINMLLPELKNQKNIIISDFRFSNEYTRIKNTFLTSTLITAKIIGKNYYDKDEYDNHISETSLNDWKFDYHLNNTIWQNSALYWQALALLQELDILENQKKDKNAKLYK